MGCLQSTPEVAVVETTDAASADNAARPGNGSARSNKSASVNANGQHVPLPGMSSRQSRDFGYVVGSLIICSACLYAATRSWKKRARLLRAATRSFVSSRRRMLGPRATQRKRSHRTRAPARNRRVVAPLRGQRRSTLKLLSINSTATVSGGGDRNRRTTRARTAKATGTRRCELAPNRRMRVPRARSLP